MPAGVAGGVGLQAHQISNELVRRGHEVTVFTLFPPVRDALYETERVHLGALASRVANRLMGSTMLTFGAALRKVNFDDFDVIHAHGDSHFVRSHRPIVRTFHSSGLDDLLHDRGLRRKIGMGLVYPLEVLSGWRARSCVFVSAPAARYFPFNGEVINNGVDLRIFKPGTSKSERPSVLFVAGTKNGRKRGDQLARQFEKAVISEVPAAELWMVCPERIEGPSIRWFGTLSGEPLADMYKKAWLFCLPSSLETFGVPLIEAMASGTPVVATPNRGAADVLDGGKFGCIVPIEQLGATLSSLLRDDATRERYRGLGLIRASAFSLDEVVTRYERLFSIVVGVEEASRVIEA
jgi:glycosyltransferase involved in cell wall biosynthesis